ncbi:hypothetical protein FKM82_025359 [Ascaphus truei]
MLLICSTWYGLYVGGDLLTLRSKFEDRLPEEMARLTISRFIFLRRDIKPDNILIDLNGHIRLADFGSCLKRRSDGMVESSVAVGTPDYISPEILQAMEDGKGRYGTECDWWSLGVSMYELLYGETPFYAESLVETYGKIMNHEEHLQFPSDVTDVSDHAKDLIRRLICSREERLGRGGVSDFKTHPFFAGVDWDNIRRAVPPYIPDVDNPADTSNFDVDDESLKNSETLPPINHSGFSGHHLPFVGFTFTSDCLLSDRGSLMNSAATPGTEISDKRIARLEQEREKLQAKDCEIRSLKKEMEILQKKLAGTSYNEYAWSRKKPLWTNVRSMERQIRSLKQEKEEYSKELAGAREQGEQLRGALEKLRGEREELLGAEEKCEGLRAQAGRLSRRLRDMEEEAEAAAQKVRGLRKELHRADSSRKEAESQVEELLLEVERQKKLRERSEAQTAEELERVKHSVATPVVSGSHHTSEMTQLRVELERRSLHLEAELSCLGQELSQRETEYVSETKSLRRELGEKEAQLIALRQEMEGMQESLGRKRSFSARAQEEELQEMSDKNEREKSVLKEENKKLKEELERMLAGSDKMSVSHKRLEEEVRSLEEKREALANWEAQITDILQWVSDEKQSRVYLQALSVKMTEELEVLRNSGGQTPSGKTGESQWKARRLQKLEASARLELQSALEAEIKAKQTVQEELNQLKSDSHGIERKLQEEEEANRKLRAEVEKLREEARSKVAAETKPQRPLIPFLSFRSEDLVSAETSDQAQSNISVRRGDRTDSAKNKLHRRSLGVLDGIEEASDKCRHGTASQQSGGVQIVCGYMCHASCAEGATLCPSPPGQIKKTFGVDPVTGTGTALEGYLSVPKPAGVKKGWYRAYVILSDFRILVYDGNSPCNTTIVQAIDMRDAHFSVSPVLASDVFHADPKDIPCIFRVTFSQLCYPLTTCSQLLLAETGDEMLKWVQVLSELRRLLREQRLPDRSVRVLKEAYDSALPLIRTVLSAAIIDQDRIALGTEEGLFLVHVNKNGEILTFPRLRV